MTSTATTSDRTIAIDSTDPAVARDHDMANVNGPCVVAAPDWLPDPPGRYLLYFGHHLGSHIRLAAADSPMGPWHVVPGGALHLDQVPAGGPLPHVASPDVHVLDESRRLRLYFHCPIEPGPGDTELPYWRDEMGTSQMTFVAESVDGRRFELIDTGPVASSYLRMFARHDAWYGLSMPDWLVRSPDGVHDWEHRHLLTGDRVRHTGIDVVGDRLDVYYTSFVDPPERILCRSVDISDHWSTWSPGPPMEVLAPVHPWEGADLPVTDSYVGPTFERQRALRDPYVFTDTDGAKWLYYAAAGEFALGVTPLP